MKWSETLIPTLKEVPSRAESPSHRLMLRAGLIRGLGSGTYSYLPLGLRVLKKVEAIVRQEMDLAGAQEVFLPAIQPAELWKISGRYEELGQDMFKFKDRHGKEIVLGPTHEEVITELVKREVRSYRELPLTLYQIQTKFRDELRPRFGVIRSCEFVMKDAYSFDRDKAGLAKSYQKMYDAYCRIFRRCGLAYTIVEADPGVMGGEESAEFMILTETGEDIVVRCKSCSYSAGLAVAGCPELKGKKAKVKGQKRFKPLEEVDTPGITTIEKVGRLLGCPPNRMVKTIIYETDTRPVAALVRGDHDVNETKLAKLLNSSRLRLASPGAIEELTGCPIGFSGPVGLKGLKIIADYKISELVNFLTGANKIDKHLINVNLSRDFKPDLFGDIRYITSEDQCPKCGKAIQIKRAIEVGHVFKLGTRYSALQGARYLDRKGKERPMIMGCYGIGTNRIVAATVETNHDKDGIVWPISLSPYQVLILLVNPTLSSTRAVGMKLYHAMLKENIEVLLDDRDERAGTKFKDADLVGIPVRVVVGEKGLKAGNVDVKLRKGGAVKVLKVDEALGAVKKNLDKLKKEL